MRVHIYNMSCHTSVKPHTQMVYVYIQYEGTYNYGNMSYHTSVKPHTQMVYIQYEGIYMVICLVILP